MKARGIVNIEWKLMSFIEKLHLHTSYQTRINNYFVAMPEQFLLQIKSAWKWKTHYFTINDGGTSVWPKYDLLMCRRKSISKSCMSLRWDIRLMESFKSSSDILAFAFQFLEIQVLRFKTIFFN